jgi:hypothetical protein
MLGMSTVTSSDPAAEKVVAADLSPARLLATAKLLSEEHPASGNYTIKVFRYLDDLSCDGDQSCNAFGIFVTFESDGELPDVAAKSVCCFNKLGILKSGKLPNTVEGSDLARMKLNVAVSGRQRTLEVDVQYRGSNPKIEYRMDGRDIDSKSGR